MCRVKIEFIICGDDFQPDEITKILKIEPTEAYYKKEFIKPDDITGEPVKFKECCWTIQSEYENTIFVDGELRKLYNVIKNSKNELLEIAEKFSVSYKFCIVIEIEGKEENSNPCIGIDKDIVKFAADIGAYFDFDTYV